MHPRLVQHIGHLLRVRVLQELEFLANQLITRPRGAKDHPIIRRLTREEFQLMKTTRVMPDKNAIAVLVVPPLNRDPVTKTRVVASSTSVLIHDDLQRNEMAIQRQAPPLSTLYHATNPPEDCSVLPNLPCSQVPLYNGITIFPFRPQRAELHARLSHLLRIERRARHHENQPSGICLPRGERSRGDQKASHAFVLYSGDGAILRADAAATAIALWRVRMWEGVGWESDG